MIYRKEYMCLLDKWRDQRIIKVVTGIRRCGKSSLLKMFRDKLLAEGVLKEQVLELNFEDLDNEPYLDYKVLLSMLKSKCFDHYFHFKLRFYILGYKAGGFWPWQ